MLGYYTPLLLLQAFCLYHAYRNNVEQRWYWLILFIPVIGCVLYLYDAFYSRNSVHSLTQGVKEVINKNYKIEQLERAARFADNVTNKTNLADAYTAAGRYEEAISLYKNCLQGFMAGDPHLRMKLLQTYFQNESYESVIIAGNELELEKEKNFMDSEARVSYAWALHYTGKSHQAEKIFCIMNRPYTNYWHRMEYCKFLKETDRADELTQKLSELIDEFEYIKGPERKLYRKLMWEVKALYRSQTETVKS
jgi:hypothetical protein